MPLFDAIDFDLDGTLIDSVPDGRHILQTLELMEKNPKTALMVGDSESDMAAARDAGVPSTAVTYGYSHGRASQLDADRLIDIFIDLPDAMATPSRAQDHSTG